MASFGAVDTIEYDIIAYLYTNGTVSPTHTLTSDSIRDYKIGDRMSSGTIPLGTAAAKTFNLTFYNRANEESLDPILTPQELDNAKVVVKLYDSRIANHDPNNVDTWAAFGVWFVDRVDCSEQDIFCTISGSDVLNGGFDGYYKDNKNNYPQTVKSLLTAVCTAALQTRIATSSFLNSNLSISSMPKWEDKVTLRQIVSYIAFVAGGFARINLNGELEVYTLKTSTQHTINNYHYESFSSIGGSQFTFNAIEYLYDDDEGYTRYAINAGTADNATNTVQAQGNPLVKAAVLNTIVNKYKSAKPVYDGLSVSWFGSPLVQSGDEITLTDTRGVTHTGIITSQNINFTSGGLTADFESDMPTLNTSNAGYSAGGVSAFNPDGTINYEAIKNLNQKVVNASKGYIGSLTADEITTVGLLAEIIQAITLKAKSISATEVEADSLTTMFAEIVNATIKKLNAGTISTDELYTALAEITAAKIESLTAGSISTDRLAAALADFTVITADTATFDKETVRHLIAQLLHVEDAVGERVSISNLSADYASIVTANVGNLVIKASDGNYYKLDVDSNGNVSPVLQTVTEDEKDTGQTTSGKPIIESSMTVSELSATGIKAVEALINKIDAARIDVATLTATTAFIEWLRTANIVNNESITLAISSLTSNIDDIAGYQDSLRRWITISDEGMIQGAEGSIYSTLIDEEGYKIRREGSINPVGSFDKDGLKTDGVKLGNIIAKSTSKGGWAWTEDV